MSERIIKSESISEFRARRGILTSTTSGRVTSGTFVHCSKQQRGNGYICTIGTRKVTKKITLKQITDFLKECSDTIMITEIYPTRFCTNKRCEVPSTHFLSFERRGHATCSKCGTVQHLEQSKMGTFNLGDDSKANKSMWNVTPGMTSRDSSLTKNGKRLKIGPQRIKSHQRHFWSAQKKIGCIADRFRFMGIECIIKHAEMKCKKFYYGIHNDTVDDNNRKMPHGQVQFAAACFYAAVLEFEQTRHVKTPATLPVIIEEAQGEVFRKAHRKTRDVTAGVIIKYLRLLKKSGLCDAVIPEITADTLSFKSKHSELEHARLAIFNQCTPNKVSLVANKPWGLRIGDTNQGVLYIESVEGGSVAFKAGLKKGDYLFQFQSQNLNVQCNPRDFEKLVVGAKNSESQFINISIMRKKK